MPNSQAFRRYTATTQEYSNDRTINEKIGGWEDSTDRFDNFVEKNPADGSNKDIL